MIGSHRIILEMRGKYKYDFVIHRNITIISGNSASGKTSLVEGIRQASQGVRGYFLSCDVPCKTIDATSELDEFLYQVRKRRKEECIAFMDEDCGDYYCTKEFATLVNGAKCYFVIIGREALKELPYSIKEIYSLEEVGKYPQMKGVFNTLKQRNKSVDFKVNPDILVIEGQGSDCDVFNKVFGKEKVIPAKGNGNIPGIISGLKDCHDKNIVVYVDGAAFGSLIESTMAKLEKLKCKNWFVIAHESFEYDVLMSNYFMRRFKSRIRGYEDKIDSKYFLSWERYFASLLTDLTKGTQMQYTKSKMPEYCLSDTILKDIMSSIGVLIEDR